MVYTHTSVGNKGKITDTDTTKGNYPHKLLTNREISAIIKGVIPLVNPTTTDEVATSGRYLHAVRVVLYRKTVMGATHSTVGVLKDPPVVNWKDTSGTTPVDRNTVGIPPITTTQVLTGTGPSATPISIGSQKIEVPRRSIILQEVRNAKPLKASINGIPAAVYRVALKKPRGSSLIVTHRTADV